MSPTGQPSPQLFFETANAYQRTAAIRTAVELGVFTAIADGKTTAAALATSCGTAERGMRILCDYLTILGFITKSDTHYNLTPDTDLFLNSKSRAYVGTALGFLANPTLHKTFDFLTDAVRKGGTALPEEHTLDTDHPMWVHFARCMAPLMVPPAQAIAELVAKGGDPGHIDVLDIAAGHGVFGVFVAQKCPGAHIVALDWPHVLEVAKENAAKMGVGDRHTLLPGNALKVPFGGPYDVVLLTNFLHHFNAATCETLLKKIHAALKPGGRVITLEFVPNDDRITPSSAAAFSLTMLASTAEGDAYTLAELERMFKNAGYTRSEPHVLPGGMQQIIVSYK